ncbi:PTS fructose transporter subunit IIB [Halorhabdus amylolytica]|uniref:PTS fructose transporter subunit IIB n=1 Tax=Halorhabdus amylolytica TaxID=2559573 RepID=UPI0010AA0FE2|nr:PTS fructose transporter subunit IIB [Halorhabdus amylolytica]
MKLVAVTSCPTGIAHSQMAAEGLEQAAENLGHEIKVEIQGAMGAENELTGEDVAEADAVIIAADTSVSRDRFEGKPLVKAPVKDGINDAEDLIRTAVEKAGGNVESPAGDEQPDTEGAGGEPDAETGQSPDAGTGSTSKSEESDRKEDDGGIVAKIKSLFKGAAEP